MQVPRRHAQEESEGEVFDKNNHQMTTYNTNDNTDLRDLLAHNIMSLNAEYGDGWELPSENLGALLSPPWECMETAARVGVHAGAASRAAPEPTPADGLPADDLPAGTALEPTPAGTLSADDLLPTAVASVASESDSPTSMKLRGTCSRCCHSRCMVEGIPTSISCRTCIC